MTCQLNRSRYVGHDYRFNRLDFENRKFTCVPSRTANGYAEMRWAGNQLGPHDTCMVNEHFNCPDS